MLTRHTPPPICKPTKRRGCNVLWACRSKVFLPSDAVCSPCCSPLPSPHTHAARCLNKVAKTSWKPLLTLD